jgi:hypothetical protein
MGAILNNGYILIFSWTDINGFANIVYGATVLVTRN